jgi:hypothetical protein
MEVAVLTLELSSELRPGSQWLSSTLGIPSEVPTLHSLSLVTGGDSAPA